MKRSNWQRNRGVAFTLKSFDTEEWIDIHFYRPLGYRWALLFRRFHVHPNVVTLFSIVLGVASGVCFYVEGLCFVLIGMCLLVAANVYDSADGQLARLTGQKTLVGRILDGFAGDLWFLSIYTAICLRLQPRWGIWIWALAAFAGLVCHVRQCQLADYYRNVHLYFLKGEAGSELDSSLRQAAHYRKLSWRKNLFKKLLLSFYVGYTRSQERMTPAFQQFISKVRACFPEEIPVRLREDFCRRSLPLMKYANALTFNLRSVVLFVSLLVGEPWLYFVFEVTVLNGLFVYMHSRHEKCCRDLFRNLSRYEK